MDPVDTGDARASVEVGRRRPPRLDVGAWKSAVARVVFLALTWWALCDGDPSSLTFGLGVVGVVAAVSFVLSPPRRRGWTLRSVAGFTLFFLKGSVHGGFDVARRALSPSLPISPVLVRYPMRLPEGAPQALFRITLCLMPGTLSADVEGEALVVHALVDRGQGIHEELAGLELRVRRLFGLEGTPPPPEGAHA
ncbi:Na+/H+ antiporter subunit E [Myxococcus fulvus]|nr:Na+/H+ antiporter subunit E [Myxococcus fulvus]